MADELRNALNVEAELIAGSGGVFEIDVDGKRIYSKADNGRFPNEGEILGLING